MVDNGRLAIGPLMVVRIEWECGGRGIEDGQSIHPELAAEDDGCACYMCLCIELVRGGVLES